MRLGPLTFIPLLVSVPPASAWAQGTTSAAVLYAEPGNRELATVAQGVSIKLDGASGQYLRVTISGFVASALLGGSKDSFPAAVNRDGSRLRATATSSGALIAELRLGTGVSVVGKTGDWTEVRRTGWVKKSLVGGASPAVAARSATIAAAAAVELLTPVSSGKLAPAPGLVPWATVEHGAPLTPLARDRGWIRVRVEGWMREEDLTAADSSLVGLSASDLRANPEEYAGRLVRWTVQVLAFQRADVVRRDMKPNEPYLLARGPGEEGALLYLTVPPDLLEKARAFVPLANALITARVRTGRGDPSGVPILDLIALTRN